jgi:lipopolysaccharide transport system permease protein
VEAGRAGILTHLREVRKNLVVGYYLVTRDVKVRYRQTVLGAAWVVAQPIAFGLVLATFVGHLAKVPSDGHPNGAFYIAGLVCWTYLVGAVDAGTNSFVQDLNLITKVYIPRLLIPLSAASSFALDLAVTAVVAIAYAILSGIDPSLRMLVMVPACAWAVLLAASIGSLFGTWNVKYRDIRAGVRFGLQIWLFMSPVAYSWTVIPSGWTSLYGANPAAGVVALSRWAILGGPLPPTGMLFASVGMTIFVALLALDQFDRLERQFADAI